MTISIEELLIIISIYLYLFELLAEFDYGIQYALAEHADTCLLWPIAKNIESSVHKHKHKLIFYLHDPFEA